MLVCHSLGLVHNLVAGCSLVAGCRSAHSAAVPSNSMVAAWERSACLVGASGSLVGLALQHSMVAAALVQSGGLARQSVRHSYRRMPHRGSPDSRIAGRWERYSQVGLAALLALLVVQGSTWHRTDHSSGQRQGYRHRIEGNMAQRASSEALFITNLLLIRCQPNRCCMRSV